MKVCVDGRFFSDPVTLARGMGRFSLNQIEAVRRYCPQIELIALVRPDGREGCRKAAPGLAVAEIPVELCGALRGPASRPDRLGREAEYADWLHGLRPDAFLSVTPFLLGLEPLPPLPGPCPTVSNIYDLIPLVYRRHYLIPGSETERDFLFVLSRLSRSDALLAISDFTRREAMSYLGIPGDRIQVGYPIPAHVFRPAPAERRKATLERLGLRSKDGHGFVLSVPHTHHTKNVRTLLRAWAGLSRPFRRRRSLVLTCDLGKAEMAVLRSWIGEEGLGADVVPTGFVSDEELADLFSEAWLYVHPSLYEGFGLPVVEAQACGTAVVASNAASLPEAVGDGGVLVDPLDPRSFRDAFVDLDEHPEKLAGLRARAPASSARFTAEGLANAVAAALQSAVTARRPRLQGRAQRRLALVSPVPPQPSGVADYTAELASALSRRAGVELFVERGVTPSTELVPWPVHDVHRLAERHEAAGFEAILHQMGASTFHVFVEDALRKAPGIVTFHDLVWGRVPYHRARTRTEQASFRRDLERLEGREALEEFQEIVARCGESESDRLDALFRRHPMIGDIVQVSRGVVVHFPDAESFVRSRFPQVPVRYFPMGVRDPLRPGVPGTVATRARFGLPVGGFVVGAFGIADPVKHLDEAVQALARIAGGGRDVVLAIVGAFASEAYRAGLRELAASLGIPDRVRFLGPPSLVDFEALLGSCDAVLNLRYPSRMQMSAVLVRALAAGVPVAITDLPEWRFFPEGVCERIPAGPQEVLSLSSFLLRMLEDPAERVQRSNAARRWYLENATLDAMASNYLDFSRDLTDRPGED